MNEKSEIEVSKESYMRLINLRNYCIQVLNHVIVKELKEKNNGKDPDYFQYVAAHYSLYIKFTTELLNNLDESLKKFDAKMVNESPHKEKT